MSGTDAIKPQLDKSNLLMGKLDSQGAHENYRFQQFVDAKIGEYRKEGKDPRMLLDPRDGNPEYLGRPDRLRPFQRTIEESMREFNKQLERKAPTAPPPPEKARQEKDGKKESIAEWIQRQFKRTGNAAEGSIPPAASEPAPVRAETGVAVEDYAFTKDVVNRLSGSHRIALSKYGSLYKDGKMSETELKQQLEITFEPYVKKAGQPDEFLSMKDFHRASMWRCRQFGRCG